MDDSVLKEHAARCRSLADKAGEFTKKRLLDLAARYDSRMTSLRARQALSGRGSIRPTSLQSTAQLGRRTDAKPSRAAFAPAHKKAPDHARGS
jgi:hypothetical protein